MQPLSGRCVEGSSVTSTAPLGVITSRETGRSAWWFAAAGCFLCASAAASAANSSGVGSRSAPVFGSMYARTALLESIAAGVAVGDFVAGDDLDVDGSLHP